MARYLLVVLLLSSCTYSPSELRARDEHVAFTSSRPAKETAQCLARAIDEYQPAGGAQFLSSIREGSPGNWEVRAHTTILLLLADISPAAKGATVTIWKAPVLGWPLDDEMAKACSG